MAVVAVAAVLMWEFGPANSIRFMRMRIVNDTQRTVKVQPCWDIDCIDIHSLSSSILRPGDVVRGGSLWEWEDDLGHVISVAVLKPSAEAFQFDGCVVRVFEPHTKVGVFRVSQLTTCPDIPEGGGSGAG